MKTFAVALWSVVATSTLWTMACLWLPALAEPPNFKPPVPRVVDSGDTGKPAPLGGITFPPRQGTLLVLPYQAHDGDTIHFYFLVEDTGRLFGINAPELAKPTEKEGLASRDYLSSLLTGKPMKAVLHGREKYGRALLSLYDNHDRSLSELMVTAGMARHWDGKGVRP